jgi:TetR/AcrR family transcriptional repressor of nem operon
MPARTTTTTTPARERILQAAQQQVLRHGFAATTVDAVLAAAGASKGAFFHHFPSKAHLGRALVERYAAADAATLESALAAVEAITDDPAEQLIELLRVLERAAEAVLEEQPSCLFVSFIYESELSAAGTDEIVAGAIRHWRDRILGKLEPAAAQRPGMPAVDLPSLADQLFTVLEGAFLLTRALADRTAFRRQLAHLRHYLELLFGLPVDADPDR